MQNIEIKCPLPDRARVEERLVELGAERKWEQRQRDTFFEVPIGWLKIREQGDEAEVIAYRRAADASGPRASDYERIAIESGSEWSELFARVLPQGGVVEKTRTLWIGDHTRIHLDQVMSLGHFLELETVIDGISYAAGLEESHRWIDGLGLDRSTFLAVPYWELLKAMQGECKP